MLGLTILVPFDITKEAPIHAPSMLQTAAVNPSDINTSPFNKYTVNEDIFEDQLISFACAFDFWIGSLQNVDKHIIKKVPVPGP